MQSDDLAVPSKYSCRILFFNNVPRPVALRPEAPGMAYAALVGFPLIYSQRLVYENFIKAIQALFMVPQVSQSISSLRLPDIENLPRDSPRMKSLSFPVSNLIGIDFKEHAIWNLVELFTNLDFAQLSSIVDKDVVPSLEPSPWDGTTGSLGEITSGTWVEYIVGINVILTLSV